MDDTIYYINIT